MTIAVMREVSSRFNECELTHLARTPIDVQQARIQHKEYNQALRQLGCEVIELPREDDLPDSVFVEDTAIVLPEVAVITRPGADSRKPETESVARVLAAHRKLLHLQAPATLDGGDVLVIGSEIFIGMSTRSNAAAIEQIKRLLADFGYHVSGVELHDCLHLKTGVTRVDDRTVLINRDWVDASKFRAYEFIEVDPAEPFGANCLPLNGKLLYAQAFPCTRERLEAQGAQIVALALDELAKAEGAITCCSLIID